MLNCRRVISMPETASASRPGGNFPATAVNAPTVGELEHFHQSCSAGLMVLTDSGLLGFWLRFLSVTGFFKPAPSRNPRHKPKILVAYRYIFSVNALKPIWL
jgi:hypothetical protein